ncbi:MAG: hypothetical protein IIB17_01035 [Chloroflexi bacterium]|nr:hypothetical protein [Chloroflexota bacterium]
MDYFTNATYLLVFIWLSTNTIVNPQAPIWQKVVAASLLGLALASRLNFFFVVPVLFSFFVQAIGWKMAIRYTGLFILVSGSIIAPFYIFDPDAYAPLLNARGKLTVIESILPWPAIIVSVLTALLTIILAAWRMEANGVTLFKQIAIIQYFGVVVIGALLMLAKHTWQFNVNHQFDYGALALPFGAFALVASLDWGFTQVWVFTTVGK